MTDQKPIHTLTPQERDHRIATEAIDGLYNAIMSDPGPFGSIAKAAKAIGVHPNVLTRTMGQTRTRRMSVWTFVALCRALGFDGIATTSEVEVLHTERNLTLEGFLALRRISGNVSDCIDLMGRQA